MPRNCQEEKTVDTALTTRCHVGLRGHFPRKGKRISRRTAECKLEKEKEKEAKLRGRVDREGEKRRREEKRNEPYEARSSIYSVGMQNGRCRSQRTTEQ